MVRIPTAPSRRRSDEDNAGLRSSSYRMAKTSRGPTNALAGGGGAGHAIAWRYHRRRTPDGTRQTHLAKTGETSRLYAPRARGLIKKVGLNQSSFLFSEKPMTSEVVVLSISTKESQRVSSSSESREASGVTMSMSRLLIASRVAACRSAR